MALHECQNLKLTIVIVVVGFIGVNAICEPGWLGHSSSCYKFIDRKMTWGNASAYCQGLNGTLLVIESADENDFITQAFRSLSVNFAWLGCSDQDADGVWMCYPGGVKRMAYQNWGKGQPNNWRGSQHCAAVHIKCHDGTWDNHRCTRKFHTVCETNDSRGPAMSCYILGFDGRLLA